MQVYIDSKKTFLYVQTSAGLLVFTVAINNFYMYNYLQYCLYILLLTIIVICTSAVQLLSIIANKNIICTNICSNAGNYCCYGSFLYVQIFAVLTVSNIAINHCYMYTHMQCCSYLLLLSITVICTNICIIDLSIVPNNIYFMIKHLQYCQLLMFLSVIVVYTKICSIACIQF